jgi:NAD(P)-dependent dehydrogenase (short-subunit alcohol dehydrogenase family)
MDVNLHAPLILTQAFAAQAVADGGNVINILDQRVWKLTPFFLSYTVSKAALWTLTQTLAMALAPGLRVNGVGPGPTLPSPRQTDAQFAQQCASTLLQRGASPEEICAAIQFILGTPSMTGQMIALDGGQHLAWQSPENSNGQE